MKSRSNWNAPLGVRQIITLGILQVGSMCAWIGLISPYLVTLLTPLADSSPFLHDVLYGLIVIMLFPFSFLPPIITLYFYQRRYDRKMRTNRDKRIGDSTH